MTIATNPVRRSALALYQSLIPFADVTYVGWSQLACDLRAEALEHTGDKSQERLDYAVDCDRRAIRYAMRMLAGVPDFADTVTVPPRIEKRSWLAVIDVEAA